MFADSGFELTSLDAIATSLNMTKRTIYRRYGDKEGFFKAVVQHAIEKHNAKVNVFAECDDGDLESTLLNIALVRSKVSASREGIILRRVIHAESVRFPEIYESYQAAAAPALDYLAELFKRNRGGELAQLSAPRIEAMSFLSLIATPIRMIILGKEPDLHEIEEFVREAVSLFLNGVRRRDGQVRSTTDRERLQALEKENGQLKLLLADAMLENVRLREGNAA